jgi:hypothetical protein
MKAQLKPSVLSQRSTTLQSVAFLAAFCPPKIPYQKLHDVCTIIDTLVELLPPGEIIRLNETLNKHQGLISLNDLNRNE